MESKACRTYPIGLYASLVEEHRVAHYRQSQPGAGFAAVGVYAVEPSENLLQLAALHAPAVVPVVKLVLSGSPF